MSRRDPRDPKSTQPNTGSGGSHFRTKIEDLTIEEICKRINIQSNILDLQSEDKGKVESALNTLSSVTRFTDRKDALYVLVGYYRTEIRTIDEIVDLFYGTSTAFSIDLSMMILKDLVKFKDISRQRIFVSEFLRHLSLLFRDIDDDRSNEIRTSIENSAWGDKLKRKFLDSLFYRESSR